MCEKQPSKLSLLKGIFFMLGPRIKPDLDPGSESIDHIYLVSPSLNVLKR